MDRLLHPLYGFGKWCIKADIVDRKAINGPSKSKRKMIAQKSGEAQTIDQVTNTTVVSVTASKPLAYSYALTVTYFIVSMTANVRFDDGSYDNLASLSLSERS